MKLKTSLLLASFLCINLVNHSLRVLAADSGDEEMVEAAQSEKSGHYQEAEAKYREAVEKFTEDKRDLPLSFALDSLGNLYFSQNQLEKAASAYSKVVEICKATVVRGTDDSGVPFSDSARMSIQKDLGLAMVALGSVYTRQTKYQKGEDILPEALLTIKSSFGPQHDCVGVALAAIGDLKFAEGNYAEAEKYYRQSLTIRRKYHALNDPALSALLKNHAAVVSALRKRSHR